MSFTSRKGSSREGSLDQYLKEISQYPLIDRAEEARLAPLIRLGEEESLNKLVRSNLRFVVSVAKKYQNQGVPLSDLINEGNLGLIRAGHKFDETKGHQVHHSPGPEDEAYDHALKDSVEDALSTVKERDAKILRLYFGLDD